MGKVWTYVTISFGLAFILSLAGMHSGLDNILSAVGISPNSNTFVTSLFFVAITTALAGLTGAGIIIGLFGRVAPEYVFKGPFAIANMVIFVSTFTGIVTYMNNYSDWLSYPVAFAMGLFGVGFGFALFEWVFGGD